MDQNEYNNLKNYRLSKGLFCGLFFLIGAILFIVGYFNYKSYQDKKEICTYKVEGYVSNVIRETSTDSDGNTSETYYPEFTYEAGDMTFTSKYSYGGNSSRYHIGDRVDFLLDPNNYNSYIVVGDKSPMLFSVIFEGIGGILFIVGLVALFGVKYKTLEEQKEETDAFIAENTISRDELDSRLKDDEDSPFVK